MFSNIVTAAKGLFSRSESEDNLADPASAHAPTTPDMATTQHGTIAPDDIVDTSVSNGSAKKSKRKAVSGNTEKAGDQHTKRRKRSSLEAPETAEDESMDSTNGHDADENSNQNASQEAFSIWQRGARGARGEYRTNSSAESGRGRG
ncbi:hypothetical protein N7470_005938 [Penicillium chermesinum]|nr:hypothetical protein N7470_005938 [Penicillium chermesinum]